MKLYHLNEDTTPSVSLDVPIRIHFGGASKTVPDFKDELQNVLEIKLGQIFKIIEHLTYDLTYEEEEHPVTLGGFIMLLSQFGKGIEELLGTVRERFEKENADYKNPNEEKVLDLSNHTTAEDECIDLAKNISAILNSTKTPVRLYDAIAETLCTFDTPTEYLNSPEHIAKLLCPEDKNEDA